MHSSKVFIKTTKERYILDVYRDIQSSTLSLQVIAYSNSSDMPSWIMHRALHSLSRGRVIAYLCTHILQAYFCKITIKDQWSCYSLIWICHIPLGFRVNKKISRGPGSVICFHTLLSSISTSPPNWNGEKWFKPDDLRYSMFKPPSQHVWP